jgi:hypothetical protein
VQQVPGVSFGALADAHGHQIGVAANSWRSPCRFVPAVDCYSGRHEDRRTGLPCPRRAVGEGVALEGHSTGAEHGPRRVSSALFAASPRGDQPGARVEDDAALVAAMRHQQLAQALDGTRRLVVAQGREGRSRVLKPQDQRERGIEVVSVQDRFVDVREVHVVKAAPARMSAVASASSSARRPPGGLGTPIAASASYVGCSLKILTRRRYTNALMGAINGLRTGFVARRRDPQRRHGLTAEQIGDDLGRRTVAPVIVALIAAALPPGQGVRTGRASIRRRRRSRPAARGEAEADVIAACAQPSRMTTEQTRNCMFGWRR